MNRTRFSQPGNSDTLVECHLCNTMVPKKKAFIPGWKTELVYECQICPSATKTPEEDPRESINCEECGQTKSRFTSDNVNGRNLCLECLLKDETGIL